MIFTNFIIKKILINYPAIKMEYIIALIFFIISKKSFLYLHKGVAPSIEISNQILKAIIKIRNIFNA